VLCLMMGNTVMGGAGC